MALGSILFLNVENVCATGILQSMVLVPAEHYASKTKVSIVSMRRNSEESCYEISQDLNIIEFQRDEHPFTAKNVFLHFKLFVHLNNLFRDFEHIHCRGYITTFIALILKRFLGHSVQVVFDVRGLIIEEAVEEGKLASNGFKHRLLKRLERFNFKYADDVISVSESMQHDLLKRFNRDSILIPNPTSYKETLNATNRDFDIVYNGSFRDWHMPELFFGTLRELLKLAPDTTVLILTKDRLKAQSLISKMGIPMDSLVLSSGDSDYVRSRLLSCKLGWSVIRPSKAKSVCNPVKFNEYLLGGVWPIVNRGIGDLEKVVSSYNFGTVIDIEENTIKIAADILRLIQDYDIAKIDRVNFDEFSWDRAYVLLDKIYEKR